jgi:hypothetical protein
MPKALQLSAESRLLPESPTIVRNPGQSGRRATPGRMTANSASQCGFQRLGHPEECAASPARGRWFETSRAHRAQSTWWK